MIKPFNIKSLIGEITDVDKASRTTVTKWSAFGNKDSDGDVITKGAYIKTIKDKGPKGANLIWHLVDHNSSLKSAIAKPSELYEDTHLVAVTKFPNTTLANDMLELYEAGHINQHSVGFTTVRSKAHKDFNEIQEINLFEGSSVLWGANSDTGTISAAKSIFGDLSKDQLEVEYERTIKSIRDGHFSDDTFSLLEIKMRQLWQAMQELLTPTKTEPEQSTLVKSTPSECEFDIKQLVSVDTKPKTIFEQLL